MFIRPTLSELVADGIVHSIAFLLALGATIFLILYAVENQTPAIVAAVSVYCGVMLLSFTVSGIYNLWPYQRLKEPLRRVDHAAIYLKIAGTYTPLVVILGSLVGYVVLIFIWAIALAGVIGKLVVETWPRGLNTGLTLTLGWSALILLWPLAQTIPAEALILIFAGGILYSVGTIFYVHVDWYYHTAIWHAFVLSASASIFVAIVLAMHGYSL